jgi:hypothetical protein
VELFSLLSPFVGSRLEEEPSFLSAGDQGLSRESSFASVSQAFQSTQQSFASPDRSDLEETRFEDPEVSTSPTAEVAPVQETSFGGVNSGAKRNPWDEVGPSSTPGGVERFYSARPNFENLSRRRSLDPAQRSQDLSGFAGFEDSAARLGALVGSSSSPDFRRAVSASAQRNNSGPLRQGSGLGGLDVVSDLPTTPLGTEEEDYMFVRKWGHDGGSPSVNSSSIGGRSSSREVMMWMGEAGMLDEEDEVIIYDESKKEPRREIPRTASGGWWPFGRRRQQEE